MTKKSIVQLKDVTKKIGGKTIIDKVSFDVYGGEVFGFLGPNGAGKTTTIRMMVGLTKITDGDVIIEGKSIKQDFKEAIQHVGAIVENPEMYSFLSGYKNLVHFARMYKGISKEKIDEVIKLVGDDRHLTFFSKSPNVLTNFPYSCWIKSVCRLIQNQHFRIMK